MKQFEAVGVFCMGHSSKYTGNYDGEGIREYSRVSIADTRL